MGIHKPSRGRRIMFNIGISIKLRKILFDCQHIRSQHKSLITIVTRTKVDLSEYLRHSDLRNLLSIPGNRSEEHTSELQSLMRISYAVFCLKQKKYSSTYIIPN